MLTRTALRAVSVAVALLCVLNLLRQAPFHTLAQQTGRFSPAWATSMATRMGLELQVEARTATEPVPNQTEAADDRRPAQAAALPAASGAPVLVLLQIPGCESERLLQQLFVPLLSRLAPDAQVPAVGNASLPTAGNASLAASHSSSTAAAMCRVGGGQRWRDRCFGEDGKLRPEVQLVTTPHLGVRHRARGETVLVVVLRHPMARLVAEFNARRFVEWRVAEPPRNPNASQADSGADDFATPLEQFRAVYRAHLRGRNPQACMIAGEPQHKCVPRLPRRPLPAAATGNATSAAAAAAAAPPPPPPPEGQALQQEWARRAARRLKASHVVVAERFEAGKRALCRALATPRSGGGQSGLGTAAEHTAGAEFTATAAAACPLCSLCSELARQVPLVVGGEGNHLTLKHLVTDEDLVAEIAEAEAIDLQLYRGQLKALAKAGTEDEDEDGGADEDGDEDGGEGEGEGGDEDEDGEGGAGDADGGGGAKAAKAVAAMAAAPPRNRRRNSSSSGGVVGRVAARVCLPTRELCMRAASFPDEAGYAAPRRRWADEHALLTMSTHHGCTHLLQAFLAMTPLTRWADEHAARVATLQRLAPPKRDHALLFTHIPKCGGSSFRNSLLFEFTRQRRATRDFGCVFYRDVHFVERRENSSLTQQGPDCLGPDGMLPAHVKVVTGTLTLSLTLALALTLTPTPYPDPKQVVTGHIGFQPSLLARFQGRPFTAVVLLREPLARLVSLFNMYPDGTWGSSPTNHSPALNFAAAYRRRLRARNALVCFVSGATLCDSVGALEPRALGGASLRLARYNLLHRYAVFGWGWPVETCRLGGATTRCPGLSSDGLTRLLAAPRTREVVPLSRAGPYQRLQCGREARPKSLIPRRPTTQVGRARRGVATHHRVEPRLARLLPSQGPGPPRHTPCARRVTPPPRPRAALPGAGAAAGHAAGRATRPRLLRIRAGPLRAAAARRARTRAAPPLAAAVAAAVGSGCCSLSRGRVHRGTGARVCGGRRIAA